MHIRTGTKYGRYLKNIAVNAKAFVFCAILLILIRFESENIFLSTLEETERFKLNTTVSLLWLLEIRNENVKSPSIDLFNRPELR